MNEKNEIKELNYENNNDLKNEYFSEYNYNFNDFEEFKEFKQFGLFY